MIRNNPWIQAKKQLAKSAEHIELDPLILAYLTEPEKIILEMANEPTTTEADDILQKKDIPVIPDILANAGGVAVSYFEWYQNVHNESWNKEEVFEKLKRKMLKALDTVWEIMEESKITMRDAAYIAALKQFEEKN